MLEFAVYGVAVVYNLEVLRTFQVAVDALFLLFAFLLYQRAWLLFVERVVMDVKLFRYVPLLFAHDRLRQIVHLLWLKSEAVVAGVPCSVSVSVYYASQIVLACLDIIELSCSVLCYALSFSVAALVEHFYDYLC